MSSIPLAYVEYVKWYHGRGDQYHPLGWMLGQIACQLAVQVEANPIVILNIARFCEIGLPIWIMASVSHKSYAMVKRCFYFIFIRKRSCVTFLVLLCILRRHWNGCSWNWLNTPSHKFLICLHRKCILFPYILQKEFHFVIGIMPVDDMTVDSCAILPADTRIF